MDRDFMEALRDAHDQSPHREILDLLYHRKIRELLSLDEETYRSMLQDRKEAWSEIRDIRKQHPEWNREQLATEVTQVLNRVGESGFETLGPEKIVQLEGLFVQVRGISAAINGRIAEKIGLKGEALADFRGHHEHLKNVMRDEMRPQISRLMQDSNLGRDQRRKKFERLLDLGREKIDRELSAVLAPEMQQALEDLKGELVEGLPDPWMGPGPPGRGGPPPRGESRNRGDSSEDGKPSKDKEHERSEHRKDRKGLTFGKPACHVPDCRLTG
jgi:hypothetical protein